MYIFDKRLKQKMDVALKKNEVRVLSRLVRDASISDINISREVGLTTQAIGKIRKKLEEKVIDKYTIECDLERIGIKNIVSYHIKFTRRGFRNRKFILDTLRNDPNIFCVFDTMSNEVNIICYAGFQNSIEVEQHYKVINEKINDMCIISQNYVNDFDMSCSNILLWGLGKPANNKALNKTIQISTLKGIEQEVIKSLIENSRLSSTEIAQKVGITSRGVCKVKARLAKKGFIQGYSVLLNMKNVGVKSFLLLRMERKKKLTDEFRNLQNLVLFSNESKADTFVFGFQKLEQITKFIRDYEEKIYSDNKSIIVNIFDIKSIIKNSTQELYLSIFSDDKNIEVNGNKVAAIAV